VNKTRAAESDVSDPALHNHDHLLTTDILDINSADAISRGIRNGESVRVFNDRGELRLVARVSGHEDGPAYIRPGVVAARLNWAKLSEGARNVNVLTSGRLTDMGGGATFYSVMVEVEPIG
jgi:anaerobic selenocysteine-containing dehydrogenase